MTNKGFFCLWRMQRDQPNFRGARNDNFGGLSLKRFIFVKNARKNRECQELSGLRQINDPDHPRLVQS
jgi:hypothetical protein